MFELLIVSSIEATEIQKEQSIKPSLVIQTAAIVENSKSAVAAGGRLGIESNKVYGVSVQVDMFTSQKIPYIYPYTATLHVAFFCSRNDSFSYLGLASINYSSEAISGKIGLIELETPFADIDDYRMLVNTFQGFTSTYTVTEGLSLSVFGANAWAGFDSGDSINTYKELSTNSLGFAASGLSWELGEDHAMTVWYYYVDKMAHLGYFDYGYSQTFGTGATLGIKIEAAAMSELSNSNVSGKVAGVELSAGHKGFSLTAMYEYALVSAGKNISNGFGGGPYLTSMDETTIATISEAQQGSDISAVTVGIGYEVIDSLAFSYAFAYQDAIEVTANVIEHNLGVSYEASENLGFQMMYTNYSELSSTVVDTSFNRLFARIDYTY